MISLFLYRRTFTGEERLHRICVSAAIWLLVSKHSRYNICTKSHSGKEIFYANSDRRKDFVIELMGEKSYCTLHSLSNCQRGFARDITHSHVPERNAIFTVLPHITPNADPRRGLQMQIIILKLYKLYKLS